MEESNSPGQVVTHHQTPQHPDVDCTQTEEQLKYQTKVYKVLMNISSRCINIPLKDVDKGIQRALREVGEFVKADRAYVFKYDFNKKIAVNTHEWCNQGIEPQIDNLKDSPLDAAPDWVESHLKGESVVISDISSLPETKMRDILEQQQIKSLISVPMFYEGRLLGFAGFDSVNKKHFYSAKEIEVIAFLGKILINLRIRFKSERKLRTLNETLDKKVKDRTLKLRRLNDHLIHTEETERKKIASDLHDSVAQTLGICLSTLKEMREKHPNMELKVVSIVENHLDQTLHEVRSLIYQLSPPVLDDFDIDIALGFLIEEFNEHNKSDIQYVNNFDGNTPVSHAVKVTLYRALNELLVNIIKHSKSKKAGINLSVAENTIQLYVEDYGVGFDTQQLDVRINNGFGLYSLTERIENLGGHIELCSQIDKGTRILISIPLHDGG